MGSEFTWQAAETLALSHMLSLGFDDAALTGSGADGGIDVVSSDAIAQVKFYSSPIGIAEVQRLRGTAVLHAQVLFYSNSGYTTSAKKFALDSGVALFTYSTDLEVTPANSHAQQLTTRIVRALQGCVDRGIAQQNQATRLMAQMRAAMTFALKQVETPGEAGIAWSAWAKTPVLVETLSEIQAITTEMERLGADARSINELIEQGQQPRLAWGLGFEANLTGLRERAEKVSNRLYDSMPIGRREITRQLRTSATRSK